MTYLRSLVILLALVGVVGCASGTSPGSPGASGGSGTSVSTPDQAARLVLASDPRFEGIGPRDPNLVGQGSWYEVSSAQVGFQVVIRVGWDDCPAGCIHEHRWTYQVDSPAAVHLQSEQGDPVPSGLLPSGGPTSSGFGSGQTGVSGRVTAGPTCPVQRNPPDPNCADRPVAGAVLIVKDASGSQVGQATSDATGNFSIPLPPGQYTLVPQPAAGLMGTAAAVDFSVPAAGPNPSLTISYDTGIR